MHRVKMRFDSAACDLVKLANVYHVRNVRSREKRMGHATGLMKKVCHWADIRDEVLVLDVRAAGNPQMDRDALTNDQLFEFYKKFGFEKSREYGTMMLRIPDA